MHEHLEPWQQTLNYEPHLFVGTWPQRREMGKALREKTSRKEQADWKTPENRPNPLDIVKESNKGRQEHLIPLRMGRMASSPFAFLRGAAAIMAWDLAQTPTSGLQVIINGDAHLNNFGLSGTPQRTVVFDLDDFDEVTYGCWEWDLKRLATSVNVAASEKGLGKNERREAVLECAAGYRENANWLQSLRVLEVWYLHHYPGRKTAHLKPDAKTKELTKKVIEKAKNNNHVNFLAKVAHRSFNGEWSFLDNPPILQRIDEETTHKVIASLVPYAQTLSPERSVMFQRYRVVDVAHRVVGLGSVGLRAYLVMLFGNDDRDPLFLQVKEAVSPAFAPYTLPLPPQFQHQGRRVVLGQRLLQAATDVLLGWTSIDGRPYYVRQMKNMKGSIPLEWLEGSAFPMYARACGTLLARAHARSGDIAKIAGYCGNSVALDKAIADFAEAYAQQTQRDYEIFVKAIKNGQIVAEMDG